MVQDHDRSSASPGPQSTVDPLSEVLASLRLSGAMLFRVQACAPWQTWAPRAEAFRAAVLPRSDHLISFHVVTHGRCWAGLRGAAPEAYGEGDVLIVPHGDAYFLADPADAADAYDESQAVDFFRRMAAGELPATVNAGAGRELRTEFLCGFLGCQRRPFHPALDALPRVIHVRAAAPEGARLRHLIDFALAQTRDPAAGRQGVLARLTELMFIEVVRAHLQALPAAQTGWLSGLRDPLVARALACLHAEPAQGWTLGRLAARIGTSRSVLAERFTRIVGQPPVQYLTHWRMQLAARQLEDGGARTLAAVAESVGYASEDAFSRAFKRTVGVAPATWRRTRS